MIGHIFIYGGIGTATGEVSVNNVKSQIEKDASELIVHIISPGGDVFEGYGIYNLLKNTGKKITTQIEGLCASISTLVAFAGDKIVMNKTSEFMIHNPTISDLKGDSKDIRNVADQLDKIKAMLIDVSGQRAKRNGKSISSEQLWALYDNETWLTASEAMQYGFVDEVQDAIKAVAKVDQKNIKHMEEKSGLEKMATRITNLFKSMRYKNQSTDTLADGRVVVVMDNNGDWTGASIMLETGEPLAAGDYELASGRVITVDDNSTVTKWVDTPPQDNATKDEEMKKDEIIKDLELKLAAALEAQKTASAEVVTAKAEIKQFSNRFDILEKEFQKISEAASMTTGDKTPVKVDASFRNAKKEAENDQMGDFALEFFKSRNILN